MCTSYTIIYNVYTFRVIFHKISEPSAVAHQLTNRFSTVSRGAQGWTTKERPEKITQNVSGTTLFKGEMKLSWLRGPPQAIAYPKGNQWTNESKIP